MRRLAIVTAAFLLAFLCSTRGVQAQHSGHGGGGHSGGGHSGHSGSGHAGSQGTHGGHGTSSHAEHGTGQHDHEALHDAHAGLHSPASHFALEAHIGTIITGHHDFVAHTLPGARFSGRSIGPGFGLGVRSFGSIWSTGAFGYAGGGRLWWPGALRIKVSPRHAEVFVDGTYAGVVDDFDGVWQKLKLEDGVHHIEIRAAGYAPLVFDIDIQWDQTLTYSSVLQRLP